MAEQTAIATTADLTARLSSQALTRLFAKSGGTTVDTAFRDVCLAEANSLFRAMTRAAFPDGVYTTTEVLDAAIVGAVVDLACEIAARRHTSWDETGAYAEGGRRAREFVKQINRDADARAPGSSAVRPDPVAVLTNDVDASGATTHPYQQIRDGELGSGF